MGVLLVSCATGSREDGYCGYCIYGQINCTRSPRSITRRVGGCSCEELASAKAVAGVNVQFPEASAVAVPRAVVPCKILTVLLASAVPVRVGVLSLVVPLVVVKMGTAVTVSMVRLIALEAPEVLPAASVAVAVKA